MNEDDCLAYDPFSGDFGMPSDRSLRDKMVICRKPGNCHICGGDIIKGDRIRSRSDLFDGEIWYYRFCTKCCEAMALSWVDEGKAIEARYGLNKGSSLNEG